LEKFKKSEKKIIFFKKYVFGMVERSGGTVPGRTNDWKRKNRPWQKKCWGRLFDLYWEMEWM